MWARHLGDDILADAGTPVVASGPGTVVWSEVRPGWPGKPNWGGIVVIGHTHKDTKEAFYTLYGHMTKLHVRVGDVVEGGRLIGEVAAGHTSDNGWWKLSHLHFAVYIGPWSEHVLPGYTRPFEGRTKYKWWRDPREFIREYNSKSLDS